VFPLRRTRAGLRDLDERQRRVIACTDAMTRRIQVPDEVFDALRAGFSEAGPVELTATVAVYSMVSRFLVAPEVRCHTFSAHNTPHRVAACRFLSTPDTRSAALGTERLG
jgi:hypothetical protein